MNILKQCLNVAKIILVTIIILPMMMLSQTLTPNPLPVNLGTAGNFVILVKTAVSTTGITHVTGDIGISPAAATFITGFGLVADATNTFSKSSLVTGNLYASNYASPTPAKMTTAIGDMQIAFTNAAGRSANYTELYAGDLTGKTLTRGVYKWGTGVLISAGGVTFSGNSTDVFILEMASNLTIASGAKITLNGVRAANIFWQVSGKTTIGTTVSMEGIILCQTNIAVSTGASLNGRLLAQTAVTLDANTIIDPGQSSPLPVSAVEPVQNDNLSANLSQNYPNPFNPSTTIKYIIPKSSYVTIKIYNILGIEVANLVSEFKNAGIYEVKWNANVTSGIYYYRINAGQFTSTKKLTVLR